MLEQFWWGSVFLLNVPIALAALTAGWLLVPESRHPAPPRLDLPGLALSVVALSSLVYGIIEAPVSGWAGASVIGSLALAVLASAAFVRREAGAREPMLDLRLFQNPRLAWGTVAITLAGLAIGGLAFLLTQYLQFAQGYTPLHAGLRFLPLAIGFGIASPVSQRLVPRIGTTPVVAGALAGSAALFAALAFVEPGTSYWLVGVALLLIGLGIGAVFVPSTDAVMAAVPGENAGLGSAINDSGRQVGAALGIGILGALANAGYRSGIGGAVTSLSPDIADAATRSVGAALEIAAEAGGPAGASLRPAAGAAFMDGFGMAMLAGAVLLAAGAAAVMRWLPSRDVAAQPAAAPSHPQPIGEPSPSRGER